ncbi:hypothetical protein IPZ58_05255 [Streptomyces roseoverticillatus]|uniref:hypothetical protein n=1 Tax=Streptomyces roseoverticillatus TaxID=66429 RepID=UPI001F1BE700|nr:hypothetical protein [Streptomyces roseoverticillatus]MCF3100982.1 hypothetical protein [Streptomyces roseoverticillatus]
MIPKQYRHGQYVKGKCWQGRKVDGHIVGGVHSGAPMNRTTLIGVTVKTKELISVIDGRVIAPAEYRACRLADVEPAKERQWA